MEDYKEIVDEYDTLQKAKLELESKIEKLKEVIINLSREKNTNLLFGTHKKCSIKEFEKVVYPENKEKLIWLLKTKGIYDNYSSLNYFKLSPKILKNEIDKEIIELVKKEKDYRVSLIDMGI